MGAEAETKRAHPRLHPNTRRAQLSALRPSWPELLGDCASLGYPEPLRFSAIHGDGMSDLYDALKPLADEVAEAEGESPDATADACEEERDGDGDGGEEEAPPPDDVLHLAVVGRPNVGKSTLLNGLVGEERALTGPEPGVTRDATTHETVFEDVRRGACARTPRSRCAAPPHPPPRRRTARSTASTS